jgi:hypothetical protein
MANAIYPLYKQAVLEGASNASLNVDDATDGPFVVLTDTGDVSYSASHDFYNDVVAATVGTEQRLDNPTCTTGTFDAADVTFTSVSGDQCEALTIYRHNSGANTTWRLVAYLDTSQTGLPVTPNGGNISIAWNASGIFTISDREVKENVVEIGNIGPARVYEYNYRGSKKRVQGFMAQEIEQIVPSAVREIGGRKRVNYMRAIERLAA